MVRVNATGYKGTKILYIAINEWSERWKYPLGISVPEEYYNPKTGLCSENKDRFPEGVRFNKRIRLVRNAVEEVISRLKTTPQKPPKDEVMRLIELALKGQNTKKDFIDCFEEYISVIRPTSSPATPKAYTSALHLLLEFGTRQYSELNAQWYERFKRWFYQPRTVLVKKTGLTETRVYSTAYFGKTVKTIKAVYNYAARMGYHSFGEIEFEAPNPPADSIYLTRDEIDLIVQYTPETDMERIVKAKFLVGCYTGLRISDYNTIRRDSINGDYLEVITTKTKQKVIIPMNRIVREYIVDCFDSVSDQELNRTLKTICQNSGLVQFVTVRENIGGKTVRRQYPKWQLVSSHTARRSFATNAYLAGVPVLSIMKLTGHTTQNSFMRYIRISQKENAEFIAGHEFFK